MTWGIGRCQLLKVTNFSPHTLKFHDDTKIGNWQKKDQVPRAQCFVLVGSQRYAEWLNLAYEATTDQVDPQLTSRRKTRHQCGDSVVQDPVAYFAAVEDPSLNDEPVTPAATRVRRTVTRRRDLSNTK